MKKYIYLLSFLMIAQITFAQTKKVYITNSGDYTTNSSKGKSYLLVQKLIDDSGYLVMQYDMQNNLISKGTYTDEALTTPSGKFTFYQRSPKTNIVSTVSNKENAAYYKASSGYYLHGKRTGTWEEYSPQGEVAATYNYENNVLNGPYKIYNAETGLRGEGTMVNGVLQGSFKYYDNDLLASDVFYENGKVKTKIVYLKQAQETRSLHSYLEQKLRRFTKVLYDSQFKVKYTVDKDGKIKDAQIISGYTPEINNDILAILTDFDGYKPAIYNNEVIDQKIEQTFNIYSIDSGPVRYYHLGGMVPHTDTSIPGPSSASL